MKIEFLGLTASGKSTVARKIIENENFIRARFSNKLVVLLWFLIYIFIFPKNFVWLIYYWTRLNGGFSFKKMIFINSIVQVGAKNAFNFFHQKNKIIIDQGDLQNVLILNDKTISNEDVSLFISRCVGKLDKVIIFSIDELLRKKWYEERNIIGRKQWINEKQFKRWDEINKSNFNILIKYLNSFERNQILVIEQPKTVDEIVNLINKFCL